MSGRTRKKKTKTKKQNKFQFALGTRSSKVLLVLGKSCYPLLMMQSEDDFPDLLPVKQVRMKRDLLGRRIYLSWMTGWHFGQALPECQTSFITHFELIYFVSYRQLKGFFTMWSIGFLVWILCLTTFIYGNNIFSTCIYCIRHLFSESELG